jgi:hypothetical protein
MKSGRFAPISIVLVVLCATTSIAQNNRSFVSGSGSDTNPCLPTSPCRTFTRAISQTNAGGGVIVLGSSGSLEVKDSIVMDNQIGIFVAPATGIAFAAVSRVRMQSNVFGL